MSSTQITHTSDAAFETDVLAGFVLARAAAGLSDNTIRSDVLHLEQLRARFGGPLWDMEHCLGLSQRLSGCLSISSLRSASIDCFRPQTILPGRMI